MSYKAKQKTFLWVRHHSGHWGVHRGYCLTDCLCREMDKNKSVFGVIPDEYQKQGYDFIKEIYDEISSSNIVGSPVVIFDITNSIKTKLHHPDDEIKFLRASIGEYADIISEWKSILRARKLILQRKHQQKVLEGVEKSRYEDEDFEKAKEMMRIKIIKLTEELDSLK